MPSSFSSARLLLGDEPLNSWREQAGKCKSDLTYTFKTQCACGGAPKTECCPWWVDGTTSHMSVYLWGMILNPKLRHRRMNACYFDILVEERKKGCV